MLIISPRAILQNNPFSTFLNKRFNVSRLLPITNKEINNIEVLLLKNKGDNFSLSKDAFHSNNKKHEKNINSSFDLQENENLLKNKDIHGSTGLDMPHHLYFYDL